MRNLVSLAAILGMALFGIQPMAKAETWWLVIAARTQSNQGSLGGLYNIPTSSEQECEMAGAKIKSNREVHGDIFNDLRYVCVKGK